MTDTSEKAVAFISDGNGRVRVQGMTTTVWVGPEDLETLARTCEVALRIRQEATHGELLGTPLDDSHFIPLEAE